MLETAVQRLEGVSAAMLETTLLKLEGCDRIGDVSFCDIAASEASMPGRWFIMAPMLGIAVREEVPLFLS